MRPLFAFLVLALCLGPSCHRLKSKSFEYTIGVDPTWYPLHTSGFAGNIFAFSLELLAEIAKAEDLQLSIVQANWDSLNWGLHKRKYSAMLCSKPPHLSTLKQYAFSRPYLLTGPVIILPKTASSSALQGKEIGVVRGSAAALILQTTPAISIQGYDSVATLLEALDDTQVDGVALEVLTISRVAHAHFMEKYQIASPPLNDTGLRLISIQGEEPALMKCFDRGLEKLKSQGIYEKLRVKWGLSMQEEAPIRAEPLSSQLSVPFPLKKRELEAFTIFSGNTTRR